MVAYNPLYAAANSPPLTSSATTCTSELGDSRSNTAAIMVIAIGSAQ